MTVEQFLAALKGGRLNAAIIDAWLRGGEARTIAVIALVVGLLALLCAVFALAKVSTLTK